MTASHVQVVTTTDSEDAAAELARSIIAATLAACIQVFPIRSFYRWEGSVQDDPEWRLEIKTPQARLDALVEHISTHHSYDVPEIIATPVTGGSAAYLGWLDEETR